MKEECDDRRCYYLIARFRFPVKIEFTNLRMFTQNEMFEGKMLICQTSATDSLTPLSTVNNKLLLCEKRVHDPFCH
jgi:hypothetical protein